MTVQVRITFGGMCLFVRDYQEKRLCVLLPHVPEELEHKHTTTLHLRLANKDVEGVPLPSELDLSSLATDDPLDLGFPDRLVDLDYITGRALPRTCLEQPDAYGVAALFHVPSGRYVSSLPGARWRLGALPPRFMATTLTWAINDVDRGRFIRELRRHFESHVDEIEAQLNAGDTTIDIAIFNSAPADKPDELPPTKNTGPHRESATQFRAFYQFYGDIHDERLPTPEFVDFGKGTFVVPLGGDEARGIDYSCTGGAATAAERSQAG